MIKADFISNKGFKWFNEKNIFVKGFLFDSDQRYFENENVIKYFDDIKTEKDFIKKISSANGLFTVFIQISENKFLFANDIIRSCPIFYSIKDQNIFISDDYNTILKKINKVEINELSEAEFKSAGFVSGHNTLINEINVTQAGEYIIYNDEKIQIKSYFDYSISASSSLDYSELMPKSKKIFDQTFERLVKSLNNRMAVVPLSGGLDSRLIACKLKEHNYSNVLCYTFGNSTDNFEKEISEKVAKELGFKWTFIKYNSETIGEYLKDEKFLEYYKFYSKYSSSFMFQDYFALKFLKENKIISDDAIFIPGYSGDFLGGSQLYKNGGIKLKASINQIAQKIVENRYIHTKISAKNKKEINNKIKLQLSESIKNRNNLYAYSIFENWEIKENLSKFIAQAAHIYQFFGYEFRFPYWDKELVDFFKNVPYRYKYGKILYNKTLSDYFNNYNINFDSGKDLSPRKFKYFKFKQKVKKIIPKRLLRNLSKPSDYLNYSLVLKEIKAELRLKRDFDENEIQTQNAYLAHWYLKQIKSNL
ncbi:MAG: hypothetical protein JEY96_00550 [Bacteroidales bacterium]|nr:hypothetical protein [Bacteroidales bacterium]